jgi:FixJ family two-component response regulator
VAVVDDDEAVRESLRFLLEIAGYQVATFPSGCDFLRTGTVYAAACLLVDQHMPQLTGLQLLRYLRESGNKTPVALMTGSPSVDLTRQAHDLGAAEVLEKPLADEVLFRFVEQSII